MTGSTSSDFAWIGTSLVKLPLSLPPMQQMLVQFLLTQQIIIQLNQKEEQLQRVCLIQIEDSKREEICVKDNST